MPRTILKKKTEQFMRYVNHYWDEKKPNYKVESCPTRETNKKKKAETSRIIYCS